MASAGKTLGDGVHEQAPSRVIGVSPEVDSRQFPIERTVAEEVAAAGILGEGEQIMASAGEAPGDGVHDQAPSQVIVAGVSPEVDSGQFPIERTVAEEVVAAAGILGEGEQIMASAREAPGDGVHDQAPSRAIVAEVSPEVDSGQLPIERTVAEEVAAAGILGEGEQIMASAREAPGDGVHDQAPSRAIVAEVSPEVDSGQLPIERTVAEEVAAAGILGEGERIMASAGEAPGDGVHDQAPSQVIVAGVSPEVDSGQFPIERTVAEEVVAAAGILGEGEQIMASAREAPGDGVHDQAPWRAIIAGVSPEVDSGQFPIKRTVGEEVVVAADILGDGHDVIVAVLRHRSTGETGWDEVPMTLQANDRWTGRFTVTALGWHEYTIQAWVDRFRTWHRELMKKDETGQPDLTSELLEGAELLCEAAERANGPDADWLRKRAQLLAGTESQVLRVRAGLNHDLVERMARYPDRRAASTYDRPLRIMVERERARFGAWYEMFPRSASSVAGRHGTFRDVEARLGYIAEMGFDVLYLPPIHPIGRAFRKGPNNTLTPGPNDPGSPWAIGGPEGGHKAIHPELGTIEDFDHLVRKARAFGIELALDIAFQCSPDHPYVREHPHWFRHRPDGTIKYAENPPKKYQDIYPIDFECNDWKALWAELLDVFLFWIDHGVKIFRVDNPHTKPFRFWDWVITEVWTRHPETIFLSEAFTRPKVMARLAKGGFTQSYTYFTWRNTRKELTDYLTELTQSESAEFMRGNLFANTPDILPEYLQIGGRPVFMTRLVLAATLGASYGIYGPHFEQCVGTPVRHGSEEYLNSEKYQIVHWDLDVSWSLRDYIARVNEIRRENPALQFNRNLRFFDVANDALICYGKSTPDMTNLILVIVNLDPSHTHTGWVRLPVHDLQLGSGPAASYQVHDLISDERFLWHGETNFVKLDPQVNPAHVLRVRRKIRTEQDFDYFM